MASRPGTVPQLDTNQTYRTIPAPTKVTDGYVLNDPLPAANVNYLWGWAGDWLTWLDERSEDGSTPTIDLTWRGRDALTTTSDGGTVTILGGDGGSTSGDGGDIVLIPGDQTSGEYGQVLVGASAPVTDFALVEFNGPSRSAASGTDLMLVASGATNSYAEIGFASYDPTEYASWYLGTWGYQRSSNPGKFYLLHYRNIAGAVINTLPFVVDDTDRVGFGTATPTSQVHLYGTAPDIKFEDTVGDTWLAGNSDGSFRVYNVTDTRFGLYIDGNGLCGIGNFSAPLGTLHVRTASAGSIAPSSSYDDLVVESSLNTGISIYSGTANFGGVIFGDADGDIRGAVLYDHGASDADHMFLQTAGSTRVTVTDIGQVGVGETDPDGQLHVKTGSAGTLTPNAGADELILESSGYTGMTIMSPATSGGGTVAFAYPGNPLAGQVYFDADDNKIYLQVGASPNYLMIDSSGNFGVNEDTPLGKAHIKTVDASIASAPAGYDELVLENNGGAGMTIMTNSSSIGGIVMTDTAATYQGFLIYDHSGDDLKMGTQGTTRLVIDSAGLVGIGELDPDTLVHLKSAAPDITYEDTTGGDVFLAGNNNGAFRTYNVTDARTDFSIDGSGNTGFNETSPLGFVHIRRADCGAGLAPSSDGDELVIENSTNVGLTLATTSSYSSFIVFSNQADSAAGYIQYFHTSDFMKFAVNSGTTAAQFNSGGEILFPQAYADDLSGSSPRTVVIKSDGQIGYDSSSTSRKKTNITDLEDIEWLYELRPVEFETKSYKGPGKAPRQMGLIAEEVEQVKKELVFYHHEKPKLVEGVQYRWLITPLLKALQEQREAIQSLTARLQAANI